MMSFIWNLELDQVMHVTVRVGNDSDCWDHELLLLEVTEVARFQKDLFVCLRTPTRTKTARYQMLISM